MSIKQPDIPPHIQLISDDIDRQIADLRGAINDHQAQIILAEQHIKSLEITKQAYLEFQPYQVTFTQMNAPLTRDMVRNILKGHRNVIQTTELIDLIYRNKTQEERSKLIKTLSVIFNQMAAEGEVEVIKKKGVKGNYYKWIKK